MSSCRPPAAGYVRLPPGTPPATRIRPPATRIRPPATRIRPLAAGYVRLPPGTSACRRVLRLPPTSGRHLTKSPGTPAACRLAPALRPAPARPFDGKTDSKPCLDRQLTNQHRHAVAAAQKRAAQGITCPLPSLRQNAPLPNRRLPRRIAGHRIRIVLNRRLRHRQKPRLARATQSLPFASRRSTICVHSSSGEVWHTGFPALRYQ